MTGQGMYKKRFFNIAILIGLLLPLLVLALLKDTNLVISTKPEPKDPLIEAFKVSDSTLTELQIKGWVLVNNKFESTAKLEDYLTILDKKLSISLKDLKIEKVNENNFKGLTVKGQAADYNVELLIQSKNGSIETKAAPETYVVMLITSEKLNTGYKKFYNELKTGLGQLASDPQVSVNFLGKSNRKLITNSARVAALEKVLQKIQAEKISSITNENLTSVNGITPLIEDMIKVGNEKINVNAAYRYNFLEEKTYFYLGSPILSTEY